MFDSKGATLYRGRTPSATKPAGHDDDEKMANNRREGTNMPLSHLDAACSRALELRKAGSTCILRHVFFSGNNFHMQALSRG